MEKLLEGKVALVTGASFGIGKAAAIAFAKEGADVVVADINEEHGLKTVKIIKAFGQEAEFVYCDVSDIADISKMINKTEELFGGLDVAFNNAGIEGESAVITESTEDNWNKVINTNLKSIWACMKFQIPLMLKQKEGNIVNCSSIAGMVGFPGMSAYTASKHGIIGITKAAALEYAKENICINAICPGVIKTPMIDRYTGGKKEEEERLVAGEPIGRMGLPEEIADAVVWLCSPKASFITGHAMAVDGGWLAQ